MFMELLYFSSALLSSIMHLSLPFSFSEIHKMFVMLQQNFTMPHRKQSRPCIIDVKKSPSWSNSIQTQKIGTASELAVSLHELEIRESKRKEWRLILSMIYETRDFLSFSEFSNVLVIRTLFKDDDFLFVDVLIRNISVFPTKAKQIPWHLIVKVILVCIAYA